MLAPSTVSYDLFLIGGLFCPALRNAALKAGEETDISGSRERDILLGL